MKSFFAFFLFLFFLIFLPRGFGLPRNLSNFHNHVVIHPGYINHNDERGQKVKIQVSQTLQPFGVAWDETTSSLFVSTTVNQILSLKVSSSSTYVLSGATTVIAGTGAQGFSGDGGPAVAATFYNPRGLALDPNRIYISDSFNHVVRVVNRSTGMIYLLAGSSSGICGFNGDGGDALNALLCQPLGLALDSLGNLIIADSSNNRIRKINLSTNLITTIAGGGPINANTPTQATSASLLGPAFLALDSNNNAYFSDAAHNCIRLYSTSTAILTTFAGDCLQPGDATSILWQPGGIVYSSSYKALFIVDRNSHACVKCASTAGQLVIVAGLCGSVGFAGDGGPSSQSLFDNPYAMAQDSAGNLFIGDYGNSRIRSILSASSPANYASSTIDTFYGPEIIYSPTSSPTSLPTTKPSPSPTEHPTSTPTNDPTSEPTTHPTSSPTHLARCEYQANKTHNNQVGYSECLISICPGDSVFISMCGSIGGNCTGFPLLTLIDPSGKTVSQNQQYCGSCPKLTYSYSPSNLNLTQQACETHTLREGCFGNSSCGGTVSVRGGTVLVIPIPIPIIRSTSSSSSGLSVGAAVGMSFGIVLVLAILLFCYVRRFHSRRRLQSPDDKAFLIPPKKSPYSGVPTTTSEQKKTSNPEIFSPILSRFNFSDIDIHFPLLSWNFSVETSTVDPFSKSPPPRNPTPFTSIPTPSYTLKSNPAPIPVLRDSSESCFDIFASYDWGSQAFVLEIVTRLRAEGLTVWLDQEQLTPGEMNIDRKMADGIANSRVPLLFLTPSYRDKATGNGPRGEEESICAEFEFIRNQSKLPSTIPLVLHRELSSMKNWGTLVFRWGNPLYVSMINSVDLYATTGTSIDEFEFKTLMQAIRRKI